MGIPGLFKLIDLVVEKNGHLSKIAGSRVAVDFSIMLHQSKFGCMHVSGNIIPSMAKDIAGQFRVWQEKHGLEITLILDGAPLETKAQSRKKRGDQRKKALKKAKALEAKGRFWKARRFYLNALGINPGVAHAVAELVKAEVAGIKVVTAQYEADPMLAWHAITEQVDYVISEDSDMLAYGCPAVICKLRRDGKCHIVRLEDVLAQLKYTMDQFVTMCAFSGCDYAKIKGVAIGKAKKAVDKHKKKLGRIVDELGVKLPKLKEVCRAILTYRHQMIFDGTKLTHLNKYDAFSRKVRDLGKLGTGRDFLGKVVKDADYAAVSRGELHPATMKPFDPVDLHCPAFPVPPKVERVRDVGFVVLAPSPELLTKLENQKKGQRVFLIPAQQDMKAAQEKRIQKKKDALKTKAEKEQEAREKKEKKKAEKEKKALEKEKGKLRKEELEKELQGKSKQEKKEIRAKFREQNKELVEKKKEKKELKEKAKHEKLEQEKLEQEMLERAKQATQELLAKMEKEPASEEEKKEGDSDDESDEQIEDEDESSGKKKKYTAIPSTLRSVMTPLGLFLDFDSCLLNLSYSTWMAYAFANFFVAYVLKTYGKDRLPRVGWTFYRDCLIAMSAKGRDDYLNDRIKPRQPKKLKNGEMSKPKTAEEIALFKEVLQAFIARGIEWIPQNGKYYCTSFYGSISRQMNTNLQNYTHRTFFTVVRKLLSVRLDVRFKGSTKYAAILMREFRAFGNGGALVKELMKEKRFKGVKGAKKTVEGLVKALMKELVNKVPFIEKENEETKDPYRYVLDKSMQMLAFFYHVDREVDAYKAATGKKVKNHQLMPWKGGFGTDYIRLDDRGLWSFLKRETNVFGFEYVDYKTFLRNPMHYWQLLVKMDPDRDFSYMTTDGKGVRLVYERPRVEPKLDANGKPVEEPWVSKRVFRGTVPRTRPPKQRKSRRRKAKREEDRLEAEKQKAESGASFKKLKTNDASQMQVESAPARTSKRLYKRGPLKRDKSPADVERELDAALHREEDICLTDVDVLHLHNDPIMMLVPEEPVDDKMQVDDDKKELDDDDDMDVDEAVEKKRAPDTRKPVENKGKKWWKKKKPVSRKLVEWILDKKYNKGELRLIGIDPGRKNMITAVDDKGNVFIFSSARYRHISKQNECRFKREEALLQRPDIQAIHSRTPTQKTCDLDKITERILYLAPFLPDLFGFHGSWHMRNIKFTAFVYQQKTLDLLCNLFAGPHTIVGFGDWSATDYAGEIKGIPHGGPVRKLFRYMRDKGYCDVKEIDEYNTSKLCSGCWEELHDSFKEKRLKDGTVEQVVVWGVKHCKNGCDTWNRDINGARNIRELRRMMILGLELESFQRPKYGALV